jgi:hypothetical protein
MLQNMTDFESAKKWRGGSRLFPASVQHIRWSIGVIAAPLVAARVWNHHTRMDEGNADLANRIQGH